MQYTPLSQHDIDEEGLVDVNQDPIKNNDAHPQYTSPSTAIHIESDDEDEERKNNAHINLIDTGHIDREDLGIPNLDVFFSRVYSYYVHKGFWCIVTQRLLKLL
jgi:hypothetical protein